MFLIVLNQWGPPRVFREQGNMGIYFLGTWEQRENKNGNMRTKAYCREQGTPKPKKYFLGTREHWKKIFCRKQENIDSPGRRSKLSGAKLRIFDLEEEESKPAHNRYFFKFNNSCSSNFLIMMYRPCINVFFACKSLWWNSIHTEHRFRASAFCLFSNKKNILSVLSKVIDVNRFNFPRKLHLIEETFTLWKDQTMEDITP